MHKDGDLSVLPVHALDLILNLKSVILCEVNMRQYDVTWHVNHTLATINVLPLRHKIMRDECMKNRLQVLEKLRQ
jgi:hypothetical protein